MKINNKIKKNKNKNFIFTSKLFTTYIRQASNIKEKAKKVETYQYRLQMSKKLKKEKTRQ